ncbi:hypothetical protein GCM10023187_08460 [Nibrella viscosa]|uniref:Lipoprotein n=1 Tax=Nibrella viscosa TaxID=1084524 RepID=A0ABP8JYW6_9BACT
MKRVILLIPLIALVISCFSDLDPDPMKPVIFPAGQHRPIGLQVPQLYPKPVKIEVSLQFDAESIYQLPMAYQPNWNKITGLSFGNVHENSARLVWRWLNNRIEIGRYTYVNGTREYGVIDTITLGEVKRYRIGIDRLHRMYEYSVWDQETRGYQTRYRQLFFHKGNLGILCNPYFGGSQPAPKRVQFHMRDLLVR